MRHWRGRSEQFLVTEFVPFVLVGKPSARSDDPADDMAADGGRRV